jgi:hypothetical protein
MFNYLIGMYLFFCSNVWARSIKATAERLGSEAKNIGLSVGLFGLAVAGIYLTLGKQDASTKITQAALGLLVIVMSPSIVNFIKGVA